MIIRYQDNDNINLNNIERFKVVDSYIQFWGNSSSTFHFTFKDMTTATKALDIILDSYNNGTKYLHLK